MVCHHNHQQHNTAITLLLILLIIYIYIYIYLFCACDCAYVFFLSFFKVILPPFCLSHRLKKYKKWVLHAFDNHHKKNALSSRKKTMDKNGNTIIKTKPRTGARRVLVTGGAGFVGSHLCDALVAVLT